MTCAKLSEAEVVVAGGMESMSRAPYVLLKPEKLTREERVLMNEHPVKGEEILKDVDGVMTADPKRVPEARRLERLSYDEMQRIADAGCGVVHPRAVDYASRHGVPLYVGSSFTGVTGTEIGPGVATPPPDITFRPRVLTVAEAQARLVLGSPSGDAHPGLPVLARRASATARKRSPCAGRAASWPWSTRSRRAVTRGGGTRTGATAR